MAALDGKIIEKVQSYMERQGMFPENGNIVAGVSGGADSVCLLLVLAKLRERRGFRLRVVHVDHGLRAEAEEDAAFVRGLCERLGIPFVLHREDVGALARREGISCEEAGRNVRYRVFEAQLLKMDAGTGGHGCVAVAHNRDDRAETFLFHLLRGTGLDGMAGIRPVRPLGSCGRIIRPLLEVSRAEIEAFLQEEGQRWRTDATNAEDLYARNRIRNRILPYAEREICAGVREHLAAEATFLQETAEYVQSQVVEALGRCAQEENCPRIRLSLPALRREPVFLQRLCVRACMFRAGSARNLTAAHVKAAAALAEPECQSGRYLSLPACGLKVVREFDFLSFYSLEEPGGEGCGEFKDSAEAAGGCGTGEEKTIGDFGAAKAADGCGISGEKAAEAADSGICGSRNGIGENGNAVREIPVLPGRIAVPGLGDVRARLLPGPADREEGSGSGKFCLFLENIPEKKYTKWFDYDKIIKSATFRTRRTGDYLTINGALDKKSLKRYMIEEKIPVSQRERMWVLADGDHIMWVPGYRISAGYKVTAQTENILEICCGRDCEADCGEDA